MRTRAQRRDDAVEEEKKKGPNTKKRDALIAKDKARTAKQDQGKPEGKKKLKRDPSPEPPKPQPKNRAKSKNSDDQVDTKAQQNRKGKSKQQSPKKGMAAKGKSLPKKDDKKQEQAKPVKKREKPSGKVSESEESEKQQVKKFTFKGKVPIDPFCSFVKDQNYQVLEYQGKLYSCTLNQTSVQNNNNKFYILQIIQDCKNPQNCFFFTRWGRVGADGQNACTSAITLASAISQYNSKYHEKFNKGNYRQVQLNYENEDDDKPKEQEKKKKKKDDPEQKQKQFAKSKLPTPVKKLIELIFDLNMMNKQMVQIGYNVSKMPLGKLSKQSIKLGFEILKRLSEEIKNKARKTMIDQLTNDFYSNIPHDFGFTKMSSHVLDTEQKVKKKIEMLESLAEIKVATTLLNNTAQDENQLDANYKKLNRNFQPVDKGTKLFDLINSYLQTTHGTTHSGFKLELQDLFQLKSEAEEVRFTNHIHNRMLLWHGSRLTNFVGILSQGLRIAPPEAPVTGYMFGKGVYFADMSSKSANYCFTSPQNSTGILLLCEVALGNMNEKLHADYYAANLPDGKHSTKGVGKTAPNPQNAVTMDDGVVVPMGPGIATNIPNTYLQYNEFIVYDVAQIKIRYLLRTKFNYRGTAF